MDSIQRVSQFFSSKQKRIAKSMRDTDPINDLIIPAKSDNVSQPEAVLSKEQIIVNKRFPQSHENLEDVYSKYNTMTSEWTPNSDIFVLSNSMAMIAASTALSGAYLTHSFRVAYKLTNGTAMLNTFLPACCIPTSFNALLHRFLITFKLFRGNDECEICDNTKSAVIQLSTAFITPIIMSSVTTTYYARYFNTYPLPDDIIDNKHMRKFAYDVIWNAIKRNRKGFALLAVANIVFGYYLADAERDEIQLMYLTLLEREYRRSNSVTVTDNNSNKH